ncbi:ribonuclease III [Martiniozyma asiatica (nom. inval.)]|nr:ribonuclease III [Martiniozyma asiatica]
MNNQVNLFNDLKKSVSNVKSSLEFLWKSAPTLSEYKNILAAAENPLIKSALQATGVDFSDPDVKFAVYLKNLKDSDKLKFLEHLISGEEIDYLSDDSTLNIDKTKSPTPVQYAESDNNTARDLVSYEKIIDIHKGKYLNKRNRDHTALTEYDIPQAPSIADQHILEKVFTHQSAVSNIGYGSFQQLHSHNERLEFLGDTILQFIVTMLIYEKFPDFSEGQLSMLRSDIVSNKNLFKWSQTYGFDKLLKKNFNDGIIFGDKKIYADVFEAYLGGVAEQQMMETIDGVLDIEAFGRGYLECKAWVEELAELNIRSFDPDVGVKNQFSRSSKQELRLLLGQYETPEFITADVGDRKFLSAIKIRNKVYGYGVGMSHQEAESRAATDAIRNNLIKRICKEENWKKFEQAVGINSQGGLQVPSLSLKITESQLKKWKNSLSGKYDFDTLDLLKSENNQIEASSLSDCGSSESISINSRANSPVSKTTEFIEILQIPGAQLKNDEKYYPKSYTKGRGGVFDSSEAKSVKKRAERERSEGNFRHKHYLMSDNSYVLCHDVLEKRWDHYPNAKMRIHEIFQKRGSQVKCIIGKTMDECYLAELWFGDQQVVTYGYGRSKKDAANRASELAIEREELFDDNL